MKTPANCPKKSFASSLAQTVVTAVLLSVGLGACAGADDAHDPVSESRPAVIETESSHALRQTDPFVAFEPPPATSGAEAAAADAGPRLVYSHVHASVRGRSVETVVTDVVSNDTEAPANFIYRFPLPSDATVTGFAHFRDGNRIEAKAKEKSEAKATFDEAKKRGETAALAASAGNSQFSVELSPLAAGESRRVELSYVQTVESFGATRSYVFPAAHSARRGGPVLDFDVSIQGDAPVEKIESLNHPDARLVRIGETAVLALLQRTDNPLDLDFSLRWTEVSEPMQLSVRAAKGEGEEAGFGEVAFSFNRDAAPELEPERDFVFVLDTSLSMAGDALAHGKALIDGSLRCLSEKDRFALVVFDDALESWSELLPATPEVIARAHQEIGGRRATGMSNVEAAVDRAAELVRGKKNPVVVFITDGQSTVGEPADELTPASSAEDFAHAQVFVALVNYPSRQPLFNKLFPESTVRYLPGGKAGLELAESYASLIAAPVLENVKVDIEGLSEELRHGSWPERLPLGETLRVIGRLSEEASLGSAPLRAQVTGTLNGRNVEFKATTAVSNAVPERALLGRNWARLRMQDLQRDYRKSGDRRVRDEIVALGSRYQLLSDHTSLVATDSLSPDRIAPGDPELRIRATRNVESVVAVLPWGERVSCQWSSFEKLWLGRFLVPRWVRDGLYRVQVFTETQGLTSPRSTLLFRVDSRPPQFALRAQRRGSELQLIAVPDDSVFDKHGDSIRLDLADVRRVSARIAGKTWVMTRTTEREWTARLPLPVPGDYQVGLVATDFAQNSFQRQATVRVPVTDTETVQVDAASAASWTATNATRPVGSPSHAVKAPLNSECFFERSARLDVVRTESGLTVELFDGFLRVGGELLSPCSGLPAASPTAIAPWKGGVAVAFRHGGIRWLQGHDWHAVAGVPADSITALAATDAGSLWIGTASHGLWRLAENAKAAEPWRDGRLSRGRISSLRWSDGVLHIGTDPRGWWQLTGEPAESAKKVSNAVVGCFRERAGKVRPVASSVGCLGGQHAGTLPSAHVAALAVHGGRLAVGTFNDGVYLLDPRGQAETLRGAPRMVNALLSENDSLWMASATGLFRWHADKITVMPMPASTSHVNGLTRGRDGTLWLATSGGLVGVREGTWRQLDESSGLPSRIVYAVAESGDGVLWVGTAGGVARVSPDGVRPYTIDDGRLPHRWVTALLPEPNGVIVGTYAGGVARLGEDTSAVVRGLEGLWINPHGLVATDSGFLAATLGGGLVRFQQGSESLSELGPLPSNDVTSAVRYAGSLWVGTRGGLARLQP